MIRLRSNPASSAPSQIRFTQLFRDFESISCSRAFPDADDAEQPTHLLKPLHLPKLPLFFPIRTTCHGADPLRAAAIENEFVVDVNGKAYLQSFT